jgi:hypothetical protein
MPKRKTVIQKAIEKQSKEQENKSISKDAEKFKKWLEDWEKNIKGE